MAAADPVRRWPRPATCVLLVAYAAVLVLPRFAPAVAGSAWFFVYLLSLPVAALVFLVAAVRGGIGLARSRDLPATRAAQRRLAAAGVGAAALVVAFVVMRLLPASLPSGSDLLRFDSAAWRAGKSTDFVAGDIAPRQKMLQDVVERVLPGSDRAAIEEALGPSDGQYFEDTGRDLLYRLGPQRDTPFSLDSEWLLIWLDEHGRFERHAIAVD